MGFSGFVWGSYEVPLWGFLWGFLCPLLPLLSLLLLLLLLCFHLPLLCVLWTPAGLISPAPLLEAAPISAPALGGLMGAS